MIVNASVNDCRWRRKTANSRRLPTHGRLRSTSVPGKVDCARAEALAKPVFLPEQPGSTARTHRSATGRSSIEQVPCDTSRTSDYQAGNSRSCLTGDHRDHRLQAAGAAVQSRGKAIRTEMPAPQPSTSRSKSKRTICPGLAPRNRRRPEIGKKFNRI